MKILIILVSFFSLAVQAQPCDPTLVNAGVQDRDLQRLADWNQQNPLCIEDKDTPGLSAEEKVSKLTEDLSDDEVIMRLIMAETLASGCPSADVAQAISWVIKNRIDANNSRRFGLGRDVVFKKYQFRSSTGDCDVAKRDIFLCPKSANQDELWQSVRQAYQLTKESTASNPIPNTYQYFFYKHFDNSVNCARWKGVIPVWAKPGDAKPAVGLDLDKTCIELF